MSTPSRWTLLPVHDEAAIRPLSQSLNNLPDALARVLLLRGVQTFDAARAFFRDDLEALHDPFLMRDMDRAADRLAEAITRKERVLVYGDYDVDGTTSTAMMVLFLRSLGVETTFFVPNRFIHGYGLGVDGIDEAVVFGASLIVTVDCGITAHDAAQYAKQQGLDLIICDHHTAEETLPEAVAVLDPKRPDCPYPFDGLSGCGVGFKLIQATLLHLGLPADRAYEYLDLVAVSTASDIVPMLGENRLLMRAGLERLKEQPRVGLMRLAEIAKVDLRDCNTSSIVFQIGPRINAAGRLDDAQLAVRLLIEDDPAVAFRLAEELEKLNEARRELDMGTRDQALDLAAPYMVDNPHALVLYEPGWHPGVIGITASRVAEFYYRPTIMLTSHGESNGTVKGSARSVQGINIYDALQACSDLLVRFGGHAFAAGVALERKNVPELRARLNAIIAQSVTDAQREPVLELDAPVNLGQLNTRFWNVLKQFGPFGPDNQKPVFWGRDLRVVGAPSTCGSDSQHLRLRVAQRDRSSTPFNVIGFGMADDFDLVLMSARRGVPLELAFTLEENAWNGQTTLQLRAKGLRLAE